MKIASLLAASLCATFAANISVACTQTAVSTATCNSCQSAAVVAAAPVVTQTVPAVAVPAAPVITQAVPVIAPALPTVAVQAFAAPNLAVVATPTVVTPATVLATPTVVTPNVVVNEVVHQPKKMARVQITRTRVRTR